MKTTRQLSASLQTTHCNTVGLLIRINGAHCVWIKAIANGKWQSNHETIKPAQHSHPTLLRTSRRHDRCPPNGTILIFAPASTRMCSKNQNTLLYAPHTQTRTARLTLISIYFTASDEKLKDHCHVACSAWLWWDVKISEPTRERNRDAAERGANCGHGVVGIAELKSSRVGQHTAFSFPTARRVVW